ncbi:substrate-binding periplasmic protein [Aliamphritea spongicola]|uniref:substrate-binding periplasmic protein n=1 Tax=Aliamphritea spongicola TaxID=707589 RepID=UPI00196A35CC|nr:transporter substrate-binding domain-containing protein [Aliamphritea spongicola]MBN3563739.1 transporter substrate-binding domain-containing protein [Aliamphritea spongicola]
MLKQSVIFLICLLCPILAPAQENLRIGFNNVDSFPYFLGKGEALASPPGISVDLINYVSEELQLNIDYQRMPGQRVLQSLKRGDLDAAFIFSYKEARREFGVFPMKDGKVDTERRMDTLSYVLYRPVSSKLNWNGSDFEQLNGSLAAKLNYSIVADIKKKSIEVVEGRSTSQLFSMLAAKRVEGVVDQEAIADAYLQKQQTSKFEKARLPLAEKHYYLIFSHQFAEKNPQITESIWDLVAANRDRIYRTRMPGYYGYLDARK